MLTSNSTPTSSFSLSAPKKPTYGLSPRLVWTTVAEPRYRPGPGSDTCSRTGSLWPLRVNVPSTAPPLEPKRTILEEVKLAVPVPRMELICFLISPRSRSLRGLAPPVPSRTSSEPRSNSAFTVAALTSPAASSGTSTCADQRVTSMVRSWPALAARPARPVLSITRPLSGPSRKVPVLAATGPTVRAKAGGGPLSGEGEVAEQLTDPAQVTQPRLGGAADPAADRLDRNPELAGGHLHGHALAAQRGRHPVGEGRLVSVRPARSVAAGRRGLLRFEQRGQGVQARGRPDLGAGAKHVDLDVVREDPEGHVDRAGRAGRLEQ